MSIVEASAVVNAPREEVFWLSQDYERRTSWDPFIRSMEVRGDRMACVGARVKVRAWTGLTMEAVFITFDAPRKAAMKMVRGPFFFRIFAGSWRFDALDGERTRVSFRYSFDTRWPCLRRILNSVIARVFQRDIRRRVEGLRRVAETTRT